MSENEKEQNNNIESKAGDAENKTASMDTKALSDLSIFQCVQKVLALIFKGLAFAYFGLLLYTAVVVFMESPEPISAAISSALAVGVGYLFVIFWLWVGKKCCGKMYHIKVNWLK